MRLCLLRPPTTSEDELSHASLHKCRRNSLYLSTWPQAGRWFATKETPTAPDNGLKASGENVREVKSLNDKSYANWRRRVFPILYEASCLYYLPVNSSLRLGVPKWFGCRARGLRAVCAAAMQKFAQRTPLLWPEYRLFLHYNGAQTYCLYKFFSYPIPLIVSDIVILYLGFMQPFYTARPSYMFSLYFSHFSNFS